MTLTREEMLAKAQPRVSEPVEIEGLGEIIIQAVSEVRASQRSAELYGDDGKPRPDKKDLIGPTFIIDQVMESPGKPMFTKDDMQAVRELDDLITLRLFNQIQKFNHGIDPNKKKELSDSEQSLIATTA